MCSTRRSASRPKSSACRFSSRRAPGTPGNWALVDGVDTTGVTVQRMVKKMDAGDVVLQRGIAVGPDETAPELQERLTALGIPLLAEAVNLIFSGNDDRTPQDE